MRYVELVGPPGVGKTTIRQHLYRKNAVSFISTSLFYASFSMKKKYFGGEPELAGDYRDFAEFVGKSFNLGRKVSPEVRAKRFNRFMNGIYRTCFLKKIRLNNLVFFDEHLAQSGIALFLTIRDSSQAEAVIRKYYESMPIADGTLFLKADQGVIASRQKQRAEEANRGLRYNDIQPGLEAQEIAIDVLSKRQVKMDVLDLEKTEAAFASADRFIRSLRTGMDG